MATSLIYEKDKRLPLLWQLLPSVLTLTDYEFCKVMIVDNIAHIVCRDTLFISIPLDTIPGPNIYIDLNESRPYIEDPDGTYRVITDYLTIDTMNRYYYEYYSGINDPMDTYGKAIVYTCEDLNQKDEFQEFLSLKSAQGARFFTNTDPNNFFTLPIFTGFPKLNKADKLTLIVRQLDYKYRMVEMIIYKKKINRTISIKYRLLNMAYS